MKFDDPLFETSHSLSPASGTAALRQVIEEIIQQRQDLHIRLLSDRRIAGPSGTDILMQIDDYEIRLALLDAPHGPPALAQDQLAGFRSLFEENPSTDLIVLTWTTPDLLSQKLNLQIVEYLLSRPEQMTRFLAKALPVQDLLNRILSDHLKVWEAAMISPQQSPASIDLRTIFLQHLNTSLLQEKERSFRTEEKKLAVQQLSRDREFSLISGVLEAALQGTDPQTLAGRLVQPARRGGR
jgi:hypothetical protein